MYSKTESVILFIFEYKNGVMILYNARHRNNKSNSIQNVASIPHIIKETNNTPKLIIDSLIFDGQP